MAIAYAAPSLSMAVHLNRVWRAPLEVEGGRWVSLGVGVMVAEFILLHAGTLLGAAASERGTVGIGTMAMLVGFYLLFIGAITLAFKSGMFLRSFLALIIGRGIAVALGTGGQEATLLQAHSIVASLIYFPLVVLSAFMPWPRRGLSKEIAQRFGTPGATGTWAEEPHRAIGAATVYFAALGLLELFVLSWVDVRGILR
jgi:hypothetical protein